MAWTAPRTWVTGETVTAALLNTHVRDNLLQTATAKVTTAGDITHATAANTLTRLGVGALDQFLVGGASAPKWAKELGDATNSGVITMRGPSPQYRINDAGTTDAADEWWIGGGDDDLILSWFDDSDAANEDSMRLSPNDFVLHTGDKGQGVGAVQIFATEFGGTVGITSSGNIIVDQTAIATGGPAWVFGEWMMTIERTSAASESQVAIQVRDDGVSLGLEFSFGSDNTGIHDLIPVVADAHTFGGSFWVNHTSANTSDYELFTVADTSSRFRVNKAHMITRVIQYPT